MDLTASQDGECGAAADHGSYAGRELAARGTEPAQRCYRFLS